MKSRIETMSQQENSGYSCRLWSQTDSWVVVEKPVGIPTGTSARLDDTSTVVGQVREMIPPSTGPMVVHRLDRETSGLVVVALDPHTHANLSKQFRDRLVYKRYSAIVLGTPFEQSGAVRLPIADMRDVIDTEPEGDEHVKRVVHRAGKPATTFWRTAPCNCTSDDLSVHTHIALYPITGRTHQLRVHCATGWVSGGIGCPIVGDPLYGRSGQGHRMMLHASTLVYRSSNR